MTRIYLSVPHMGELEERYVREAFAAGNQARPGATTFGVRTVRSNNPTPKQRSTLELLQYMAIIGPTQVAVIFDRAALSAAWSPRKPRRKQ